MLQTLLKDAVETRPEKTAIVYQDLRLSYQQLYTQVNQLSTGLATLNIKPSDCVAVVLPNCPEFIISLFAINQLQAIMLPLNPLLSATELTHYLLDNQAKTIITDTEHVAVCQEAVSALEHTIELIVTGKESTPPSAHSFQRLIANSTPYTRKTGHTYDGAAIYLFTSGSTSEHKRVCRSQKNLYYEGHNFVNSTKISADDSILCAIPLHHSYGLGNCLLAAVCAKSTLVILPPYQHKGTSQQVPFAARTQQLLSLTSQEKILVLPLVPHQFETLCDLPAQSSADFSNIKWCISSGNFLPEDVFERFLKRFQLPIRSLYGSTETGSIALNLNPADEVEYGCLGQPLQNVSIRIIDDDGRILNHQTGHVLVNSSVLPNPVYDNKPELNEQVMVHGYYRSGDIGRQNEAGCLVLTGRTKTFIDSAGYKVDPAEVEQIIKTHPKVKEVAVLGVPVPHLGEMIKAVIAPNQGMTIEEAEILSYCQANMASFKCPRMIEIRQALPRNELGKVPKRLLAESPNDLLPVNTLVEKFQQDLLKLASDVLNVSVDDVDLDEHLSEYGFDSISFTEFTNRLNEQYQLDTTPAIWFEYPSLGEFARALCQQHQDHLLRHYEDALKTTLDAEHQPENNHNPTHSLQHTPLSTPSQNLPIAIIGMHGIMPQSTDLDAFWQHLIDGDDLITEIPKDRWDWRKIYGDPALKSHTTWAKWGGFMPDVDKFDAQFFGISPHEAALMDPQQRLFLETVWKTIENAGYPPAALSDTQTGVFAGVATDDYAQLLTQHDADTDTYSATGIEHCILANRISYLLNLKGSSEPVNTACSSSLVAVLRAVDSIRNGHCQMAIAGGANVMLTPKLTIAFSQAGMLSKDGRCKTFDRQANGYVRGEGVGAILLKPLAQAELDGDHIYAVIKGGAENHGGHATSLTAPNPAAQAELIADAYRRADLHPATINYIETHGTGTSLGDPIEVNGLKSAFAKLYQQHRQTLPTTPKCALGSVKSNIGHLEAAAGIAGLFKVLLSLQHQVVPANLHFRQLNPHIKLDDSPFYIVAENTPWPAATDSDGNVIPRRAGVSSFGFGGANAHIVLEEYPFSSPVSPDTTPRLILLSAKNRDRLKAYARQWIDFVNRRTPLSLESIAYTSQTGREAMTERLAMIVSGIGGISEKLSRYLQGDKHIENVYSGNTQAESDRVALLPAGIEEKTFINTLIEERKLSTLAQLWACGGTIDWSRLYLQQRPRRIPLPTYPFAKTRHWVTRETTPASCGLTEADDMAYKAQSQNLPADPSPNHYPVEKGGLPAASQNRKSEDSLGPMQQSPAPSNDAGCATIEALMSEQLRVFADLTRNQIELMTQFELQAESSLNTGLQACAAPSEEHAPFSLDTAYMPGVTALGEQLTAHLNGQLEHSPPDETAEQLSQLSIAYIRAALLQLGFHAQPGARRTTPQLIEQLAIAPNYHRLLQRLLEILAEAGDLRQEAGHWVVVRGPEPSDEIPVAKASQDASVNLLEHCGSRLAEVLRGTQEPLALLFPGGDAGPVNRVYQDSPGARAMNALVAATVARIIAALPAGQGIRILEIGAGTGGTTASILPLLPATRTEYLYTDIGLGLLNRARKTFADFSFIDYRVLNIEQDPLAQDFVSHHWDLIIASNVFHATRDLARAASHAQNLLKPGGMLVLLEDIRPLAWVDLTFGLTEGWWRFQDFALRPHHPLLNTEQWQTLLMRCGFETTSAVMHPQFEEAIILAKN
ncbi:MAG: AMP-binding protein [Gammaproteobacteria bacterium]|nr:AMP-binding protein [Gammaproteobacteria bacterium]